MYLMQGGLLAATVVLGTKTGIILGTSWLSRRFMVLVAAVFGISLYGLVLIFSLHQQLLVQLLDRYTFMGSILMAVLLIYLGLQQGVRRDSRLTGSGGNFKYLVGFLPCPLCLAALAFSVIIISPMVDFSLTKLGWQVALFFTVLVLAVAIATGKLVYIIKFNPAEVFNNVLLFIGIMTIVFALMIPNFVQAMTMPLAPLSIGSPHLVGLVAVGMVVLGVIGYMMNHIGYVKERD